MKYGIIAAGEGSRLAAEGVKAPKPLVKVNGQPLIDRLLGVFMRHDAQQIAVICNDLHPEVCAHLRQLQCEGLDGTPLPLQIVVKTTPSSMHSFHELSRVLGGGMFCVTTVDTIFREADFGEYIRTFQCKAAEGCDGVMGVTDYIDDEKPLYVDTDDSLQITAFLDQCSQPKYISGGIYGLTTPALQVLQRCMERGESRMRNFQRALIADGLHLQAHPFSKVLDIDHATDIAKAEAFLQE